MLSLSNHHLGDAWLIASEREAHLFVLHCPLGVDRHTRWSIGQATSHDLKNWTWRGSLFHSDPENPNRSCLSTGSVVSYGNRYVMAFLANHNQPNPGVILAESEDLLRWREIPGLHCQLSVSGYSVRPSLPFKNPRWRDPFLFQHEGWLYQLMTAADDSLPNDRDGVIAVMRTRDLQSWEYLPPLRTPPIGTDLECPKLYFWEGRWHLLVSLFNVLQAPDFAARQPAGLNPSTTFALVADSLESDFTYEGSGRVLGQDVPGCPYACSALRWRGEWSLLGTCWSDRKGDTISDPVPLTPTPSGFRNT
jgi:beta-fructofuranosidase